MRVRRSRVLPAPPEEVWRVVADPHHLPRWWPRTARVEDVRGAGWTSVLSTDRGRSVRADYRVAATGPGMRLRWEQVLPGTPFEKLLREAVTEVRVEADGAGARVELALSQRPRGWARVGAPMLRGAARRQLDEALEGLGRLVS